MHYFLAVMGFLRSVVKLVMTKVDARIGAAKIWMHIYDVPIAATV